MSNTLRRKMFKLGGSANTHGVGITSGLKMNKGGRVGFQPGGLATRGIQPGSESGGNILNRLLSSGGFRSQSQREALRDITKDLLPLGLGQTGIWATGGVTGKTYDQFLEANPALATQLITSMLKGEMDGVAPNVVRDQEAYEAGLQEELQKFSEQKTTPFTMEQITENPFIGSRVGDYSGTALSIEDLIEKKKEKDATQRFLEMTGGLNIEMPEDSEFKVSEDAPLGGLESIAEKVAGAMPDRLQALRTTPDLDVSDLASTLPTEEEKRIAELREGPDKIDSTKDFKPTVFEDLTASPKDIETADEKEKEEAEDVFSFEEEVKQRKEILSDLFEDENMSTRAAELLLKTSAPLLKGEGFGAAAEAAGDVLSAQAKRLRDVKNAVTTQSIKDITAKETAATKVEAEKDLLDRSIEFKERSLLANVQLGQAKLLSNEQLQLMGIRSAEDIAFAQMQNTMARDELKSIRDEKLQKLSSTTQLYLAQIQNDTAKQNLMLNQNFQRELALFDAKVDSQIATGKIDASLAMAKYDALFQAASDSVPRAQDFVEATFSNGEVLNMPTYTYGEKMEGKEDGELITDANIFEASQDIKTDQLLPNQIYIFNSKYYFTDEKGNIQAGGQDLDSTRSLFTTFLQKQKQ